MPLSQIHPRMPLPPIIRKPGLMVLLILLIVFMGFIVILTSQRSQITEFRSRAATYPPTCNKDTTKSSNTLTLQTGRRVAVYFARQSPTDTATITLKNTANAQETYSMTTDLSQTPGKVFRNVFVVGSQNNYEISVKIQSESQNAYGWIPPNGTRCGKNGHDADYAAYISQAQSLLSGPLIQQCWGDALVNDCTQDYDFNDFFIAIGYENDTPTSTPTQTPAPGVTSTPTPTPAGPIRCILIKVYKNGDQVNPATLVPGDRVELAVVHSGGERARITVNGTVLETSEQNASGEFIVTYVVPEGQTAFALTAQILRNGQWY